MTKKRKFIKHLPLVLASLALGLGVFVSVDGFRSNKESEETTAYYTPSTHYEVSDTASELANYYSSISDSDTGTSLLNKLQTLNSTKRKRTMGYSTMGTDTSGAFIYTDYDLNNTATDSNGQTYGTKVASFYTKTSATSWNREHMWPNSHGGNNVEADILHTRPTISSENSSRGNSFYVEGKNNSSSGWDPYTAGYEEYCRGECARVILYCVVAYPSFTLSDADSHSTSNSNKDNMMGNMNTLIKWHFNYLPNIYEKNRNDGAEYLQGNRNPFVDHPEYVARIWSNFNSTVSNLCSSNSSTYSNWVPGNYCNYGSNTPVQPSAGVTISSSTASINVGSTTTLSATSTDGGAISWTTSNSSVTKISSSSSASGANITITGVAAGTATITAKRTISGTLYSQTCKVTVTKVVSSLSKGSTSPSKTTYTAGESFDPTGLTITATYSDSTTANVTSSVVWSPNPLTAGTTSITGTFGGKTITITGLTVNQATEPEIIDSNSDLSVGNYVVLRTAAGIGVTGWNNNKDATVSETESEWKRFYVASASSSGFTLKDESANSFIATPGSDNKFVYGSAATCSTDSSGHLICNSRYLCKNGTNYRFYGSISSYLPFFIYKVPGSSSTKTLSSISISNQKTSYNVGDTFVEPTVTATFSDNSTSDVTNSATFAGYNMSVAGNYTVAVSYTYNGSTETTSYQISVTSSGGGQSNTGSQRIVSKSDSSYYETGSIYFTGSGSSSTSTCDAFDVSWLKNSGTNDINITYDEIRIYASHSFTITPKTGYTITSILITANSNSYASAVGGSSVTNCTMNVSISTVTLTPTNGNSAVGFTNSAQSRLNYVVVNYTSGSSGSSDPLTSISAVPNKTFYVGETITTSDITVTGNNGQNISGFSFASYQFVYSDASSGGTLTNKIFTNAVTYETLQCSLTVQVQRKAYTTPATTSLTHTGADFSTAGIGSSYTTNQSVTVDGIVFEVDGYIYSSKLSLSSSKTSAPGKVVNTTPYSTGITNVTISGATPDIQLSTDGSVWTDLSSATPNSVNYFYLKIFYKTTSQSNYVNITSITVTLKGSETPSNIANYIMYEDTTNQCVAKLDNAITYLSNLSSSDRSTFASSNDYVISTARTRLNAWAASQGKTIDYTNAKLNNLNHLLSFNDMTNNSVAILIVIVSIIGVSAIGVYIYLNKRKHQYRCK